MRGLGFRGFWSVGLLCAVIGLLCAGAATATAAGPAWRLISTSNTTAPPGQAHTYYVDVTNVGDQPTVDADEDSLTDEPYVLTISLPSGIAGASVASSAFTCSDPSGAGTVTCESGQIVPPRENLRVELTADVATEAAGVKTAGFTIEGGGAASATTVDPTTISTMPPVFGIDAFSNEVRAGDGSPLAAAAAHPFEVATAIDFNLATDPRPRVGPLRPVESVRDVFVSLPPGFVGSPAAASRCAAFQLANSALIDPRPLCPSSSQVGTILIRLSGGPSNFLGPVPVFNMEPPPGVPGRFGFNVVGTVIVLDAEVRSGSDYGVTIAGELISQVLPLAGTSATFWGVPADESHRSDRACPGDQNPAVGGPTCESATPPRAFLRNPTSCTGAEAGLRTGLRIDSWEDPGDFEETEFLSHQPPGYPYVPDDWGPPVGIEGCEGVPFEPSVSVAPTTSAADSPSGLEVDLTVPQDCWVPKSTAEEIETATCQSDLRAAEVTLPAGMSVNPSSATGLGACSESQIGYLASTSAPFEFTSAPASCPNSSKIGTVEIETPLLEDPLSGAAYLAEQDDNPFGSLLAMYLVAEGSGVVVKQAGEIEIGPGGRLTTRFADAPQTPFSSLHLELFGGPRAALRTPPTCGAHTAEALLTPWSGNGPVELTSSFQITSGPEGPCPSGGFEPKLDAGSSNPAAGAFSPFVLKVSREDGTQELGGISASPPPGLLAKLAGAPYCPEAALASVSGDQGSGSAQLGSPSCPAASRIGTVIVGAGAGSSPFYTQTGKAYLAGPYKGAPLSLAVIVPALAGPFDLGSVLVRNALQVDPSTARVTAVSDPLPSVLHGIPLDLRDVRVKLDRPDFTLNPTNCDPLSVDATLTSVTGASAQRSSRFQVSGCDGLGFRPGLKISLKGRTRRAGYPKLRAVLTPRPGDANIGRTSVVLPASQFIAQNHLADICTRVQFSADACPQKSVYGYARAFSPLLDRPLEGPVYLRANGGVRELPDLVAALDGQIAIELVGYIDSVNRRLRTRFASVPDAPVSKFVLSMKGGSKGLLQNSENLCVGKHRATIQMDGQNGRARDFAARVRVRCGGRGR